VSESQQAEPVADKRRSPHVWVSTTYFAEGYPYTIINNLAEILFQQLGASLRVVGLTSLFHLPWNLKFLWGPLLDRYETKRRWLIGVEVLLTIGLVVLALVASQAKWLAIIGACFMLLAVLAATHDIAIDGYYLEALDEDGQSRFVGYRAMAYKAASLVVRGPLLIVTGMVGWSLGILAMAVLMGVVLAVHVLFLPRIETRQLALGTLLREVLRLRVAMAGVAVAAVILIERRFGVLSPLFDLVRGPIAAVKISLGGWIAICLLAALAVLLLLKRRLLKPRTTGERSSYSRAFVDFLAQPKVGRILAFVVLFRCGESFLQKMKWPFLSDVMKMSIGDYGWVNGTLGVVASFIATFAGGWLISKHGLRRWIWPFIIAQNLLNLLYAWLASLAVLPAASLITAVITLEHFGEGLGTAVFMVYLMRCCDPRHKAAHMAIVTALMSVSFTIAGVASGFIAERIGFSNYFLFSFMATLPGMALVLVLPHIDGRESAA
jgi:PAT family beta-lactamase induction signal transducer AmpG